MSLRSLSVSPAEGGEDGESAAGGKMVVVGARELNLLAGPGIGAGWGTRGARIRGVPVGLRARSGVELEGSLRVAAGADAELVEVGHGVPSSPAG